MKAAKTIIVTQKEPVFVSMARDTFSIFAAFAIAIPGWWFGSWALEMIGFILFWVILFSRLNWMANDMRCTPDEARAKIAAWEAGQ